MKGTGLNRDLAHVLWMGGSPCSGKSSIAEKLANAYGLMLYHCDDAFWEHADRVDRVKHPTFYRLTHMTWDEMWMRPVDVQISEEIACYREELEMIVDDLRGFPRSAPILAEGAALLPDVLADMLVNCRRALWVVPTAAFQRAHYTPERRPWVSDILAQCENPDQAFQNWMDRDAGFATQVAGRVEELGLALVTVDGSRTIAENAEIVVRHFGLMEE